MDAESPRDRASWIVERARSIGFDLCGIAPVEGLDELRHLTEWLSRDYAGEMKYLHDSRRADPRLALEGARSMIVVALNYNCADPDASGPGENSGAESLPGWISRYAWGSDYHEVIKEKLDCLLDAMRGHFTGCFTARAYVDTGPIIERIAAKYAGLGWLAKNTCLINQRLGSWLFLGVIVTTLELQPSIAADQAPAPDLCGSCTRCLDACPTQAFPEPYVLDSRRCISYLTIELRDSVPESLREKMGNAVVGCDICQDVCPWNRKAPLTGLTAFQPREIITRSKPATPKGPETVTSGGLSEPEGVRHRLFSPDLLWLGSLSREEFSEIFRRSAVKRAQWRGLMRNVCIALGNADPSSDADLYSRIIQTLKILAVSADPMIVEHARWALARLAAAPAAEADLERRALPDPIA